MTDLHALIHRMADELDHYRMLLCDDRTDRHPLATEARAALAAEPVGNETMPPRVGHILRLAEIIREVDGNHGKGAAALAEAILSHPDIRSAGLAAELVAEGMGPTDEELANTYWPAPFRNFDGMCWPVPGERLDEVEWGLRYKDRDSPLPMEERLLAASVLAAYCSLVSASSHARDKIIYELRKGPGHPYGDKEVK